MVVDIRYHLASIVAVFLALGLGILVGTSLSDGEGFEQQEKWLSALENELGSLRESGERTANLLRETGAERDRYAAFASELSAAVVSHTLDGERAALVVLGKETPLVAKVQDLLRRSGASVVRRAAVAPDWTEADLIRLLSPPAGLVQQNVGSALATALVGETTAGFTSVESPMLSFEATGDEPATIAVLVVGERLDRYRGMAAQMAAEFQRQGIRSAAVIAGEGAWSPVMGELNIPYVSHLQTPMGELSLALLLAFGGNGGYGFGDGRALWPRDALR